MNNDCSFQFSSVKFISSHFTELNWTAAATELCLQGNCSTVAPFVRHHFHHLSVPYSSSSTAVHCCTTLCTGDVKTFFLCSVSLQPTSFRLTREITHHTTASHPDLQGWMTDGLLLLQNWSRQKNTIWIMVMRNTLHSVCGFYWLVGICIFSFVCSMRMLHLLSAMKGELHFSNKNIFWTRRRMRHLQLEMLSKNFWIFKILFSHFLLRFSSEK